MKKRTLKQRLAGLKGKLREEHFANGGSLSDWRGTSNIIPDKKKKENKDKCNGKAKED